MKRTWVSMKYWVGFSSYKCGLCLLFTMSFRLGLTWISKAHHARTMALVMRAKMFALSFCITNGQKKFPIDHMDSVATPLWGKCEDEIRTPKSGNLESSGTPATSDLDCRGQNTSPWGIFYTLGKALKCRCRKWPCMSHSDICSTSYGRKKGRESNW
jgi:hypothetical protein